MRWQISNDPFGVSTDTRVLTRQGWRSAGDVEPGTPLAHPHGLDSLVVAVSALGTRDVVRVTARDGSSLLMDVEQPIHVLLGSGRSASRHMFDGYLLQDALRRDQRVALPRHAAYEYGSSHPLPLDPWFLGALLGDGYLRRSSVQWCNQDPEMHARVAAALPAGCRLTALTYGQAGTGSASIIGTARRHNPVLAPLRDLGLAGKLAPDKHIPRLYMEADREARHALLQGLLDTDGSIDQYGRIEFSSASEQLSRGVVELVIGLGGRATLSRKTGITFTSPRQATPKAGRDAFRLTSIRLPEGLPPFRRSGKAARVIPHRQARSWRIRQVEYLGEQPVVGLTVTADDGLWIADGGFTLKSSPLISWATATAS
jgi:ATP-dependent DNA helicase RecG